MAKDYPKLKNHDVKEWSGIHYAALGPRSSPSERAYQYFYSRDKIVSDLAEWDAPFYKRLSFRPGRIKKVFSV